MDPESTLNKNTFKTSVKNDGQLFLFLGLSDSHSRIEASKEGCHCKTPFLPCLQIFLKKETYLVHLLYVCFGGQACFCFFVCKQRECLEEYYANVITLLLLLYFEYFIGATGGDAAAEGGDGGVVVVGGGGDAAAEGFLAFCGHLVFANQPPLQLQ